MVIFVATKTTETTTTVDTGQAMATTTTIDVVKTTIPGTTNAVARAIPAVATGIGPPSVRLARNTTTTRKIDKLSTYSYVAISVPAIVPVSVKGSLRNHQAWWIKHEPNLFITRIIQSGYILPLLHVPEKTFLKNNLSARLESEFVETTIAELLLSGVIIETISPSIVINPLTVAHNKLKKRLVLDL